MACPLCNHTMQNLGLEMDHVFWCPRCGTLKAVRGDFESVESPRWARLSCEGNHDEVVKEIIHGVSSRCAEERRR